MACNYFFKNVLIGDEFQLNDFLIKNKHLIESNQTDIVFQKTPQQQSTEERFFKHIQENKSRCKLWKQKQRRINTVLKISTQ